MFFSRSFTISSIYILVVRNTPYGNGISPEPNLCMVRIYVHPKMFCTDARSVRCTLQPEKRLRKEREKYHSAIYWTT